MNAAPRMEEHGEARHTEVSEPVLRHVEPYFEATGRGPVEIKNKGATPLCFHNRPKTEFSADAAGCAAS